MPAAFAYDPPPPRAPRRHNVLSTRPTTLHSGRIRQSCHTDGICSRFPLKYKRLLQDQITQRSKRASDDRCRPTRAKRGFGRHLSERSICFARQGNKMNPPRKTMHASTPSILHLTRRPKEEEATSRQRAKRRMSGRASATQLEQGHSWSVWGAWEE